MLPIWKEQFYIEFIHTNRESIESSCIDDT